MAIPKAFPFLVFAAFGIIGTTLPPIAGAALAAETSVRLQSHNPVRIRDLLDGYAKNDPAQTIDGILSIPGNGDDVPAMLIMHGSGGIGQRGADYQQLLNFMGIATLRIDSFGPRGVRMTVDDQTRPVGPGDAIASRFTNNQTVVAI